MSSSNNIPADLESYFKDCPKCETDEAWHGCITEDGSTKFACDECGWSLAIKLPEPPKVKRPFKFDLSIENGVLYVDVNGDSVVTFKPRRYLQLGSVEIVSSDEMAEREEDAAAMGRMIGRELAERDAS